MKGLAADKGWSKQKCEEMFILGYLHDVGYEFSEQQCDHANIGGEMLRNQGYKYWKEVSYHGKLEVDYSSEELDMLNMADMRIDSKGNDVGVEKRLEDIATRYGKASMQFIEAELLAKKMNLL